MASCPSVLRTRVSLPERRRRLPMPERALVQTSNRRLTDRAVRTHQPNPAQLPNNRSKP